MIRDVDGLASTPARATALACVEAGIEAAHPRRVVSQQVTLDGDALVVAGTRYDLGGADRLVVVGGGKAAGAAAAALEAILGDRLADGIVVGAEPHESDRIDMVVGDHPVPTARSVAGGRRVLETARNADASTLVLAVVTGGGSAMLCAPAEGVDLADLEAVTDDLLASGATIHELNAVRKHLSAVKGGGLARAAAPARLVGLILSDVVGDDLDVIASGPTAPDASTFADARAVLDRYGIDAPPAVRDRLERGEAGEITETAGADDRAFDRATNHVIATGLTALEAARDVAVERGYRASVLSSRVRGEAREAAKTMVGVAEEVRASSNPLPAPAVVLAGGECTVTVTGDGTGGPNQEFCLSAAIEIVDEGVALASVDTDGRDGATDAAGALVDASTVDDRQAARDALADNDAHPYLAARDALLVTGATGTNVNDLRAIVVEA